MLLVFRIFSYMLKTSEYSLSFTALITYGFVVASLLIIGEFKWFTNFKNSSERRYISFFLFSFFSLMLTIGKIT